MISDTPRTDAALQSYAHLLPNWLATDILAPVARQLERELAEAQILFELSKSARKSLSDACDSLQTEIRELKQQRDRLAEAIKKALNSMSDSSYGDRAVTGKARTALTEALEP